MGRQTRSDPLSGYFDRPVHTVAPALLGGVLSWVAGDQVISVRLTEVEAYGGAADPGSHAHRGRTARNATMFGPPGHLYCYLSYGMHRLLNIVCQQPGDPAAVLLRAGEVVSGHALAHARRMRSRGRAVAEHELARGPGCLGQVFAATAATDGAPITLTPAPPAPAAFEVPAAAEVPAAPEVPAGWSFTPPEAPVAYATGPRVGVSGPGGDPDEFPWRFFIPADPTVSRFVPGRRRTGGTT